MATVARTAEPDVKDARGPIEATLARVPIANEMVADKVGPYGETVRAPQDALSTLAPFRTEAPGKFDPVAAEVGRLVQAGQSVSVPIIGRNEKYAGKEQAPDQQRLLQGAIGKAVHLHILEQMNRPEYEQQTDKQKADTLSDAVRVARQAADLDVGEKVNRDDRSKALFAWAAIPHYAGMSGLSAEQVRQQNLEIAKAKAKLSAYRKEFGRDAGESRLLREDKNAWRLAQRESLPDDYLKRKRADVDRAFNGALSREDEQGLVGAGQTIVRGAP